MAEKSNPSARERDRRTAQSGASKDADVSSQPGIEPSAPTSAAAERARDAGAEAPKQGAHAGVRRNPKGNVRLRSSGSLERLRDRVENVAHELKHLREENQALSERIKELESRPNVAPQGTFLSLEHDPDLLRRKINGFIEAIDRYLENERKRS